MGKKLKRHLSIDGQIAKLASRGLIIENEDYAKTIVVVKQIRGGLKMSDEKRRKELNAKINEQPDNISIEDLEKVAGGMKENYWCRKCGTAFSSYGSKCPKCGSTKTDHLTQR